MECACAFAEGLTPGTTKPVDFVLEPPKGTDIQKLTVAPSVDAEHAATGCEASWFTVGTKTGFWREVLEGKQTIKTALNAGKDDLNAMFVAGYELTFTETGTNQSAREGATVTLKAVATP
jgi:hypothetical protein